MVPEKVVSFASAHRPTRLTVSSAKYWRKGAAIQTLADGRWQLDTEHDAVRSAREAIIERIETTRRNSSKRSDPAVVRASIKHFERKREDHAQLLADMRRRYSRFAEFQAEYKLVMALSAGTQ